MQSGDLDQRIRLEAETRTPDGGGGWTISWSEIATVWARVLPISAREALRAGQLEAAGMYRVTIRNRRDISPGAAMRIVWVTNGDMVLNIRQAADPGARAQVRELVAESGVA